MGIEKEIEFNSTADAEHIYNVIEDAFCAEEDKSVGFINWVNNGIVELSIDDQVYRLRLFKHEEE